LMGLQNSWSRSAPMGSARFQSLSLASSSSMSLSSEAAAPCRRSMAGAAGAPARRRRRPWRPGDPRRTPCCRQSCCPYSGRGPCARRARVGVGVGTRGAMWGRCRRPRTRRRGGGARARGGTQGTRRRMAPRRPWPRSGRGRRRWPAASIRFGRRGGWRKITFLWVHPELALISTSWVG
jgi:hypothetical protein